MIAVIFEFTPAEGRFTDYMTAGRGPGRGRGEVRRLHFDRALPEHHRPRALRLALVLARRGGGAQLAQPAEAPRGAGEGPRRHLQRLPAARRAGAARLQMDKRGEAPQRQRGGARLVPHTFLFEEGSWKVEGEHRDACRRGVAGVRARTRSGTSPGAGISRRRCACAATRCASPTTATRSSRSPPASRFDPLELEQPGARRAARALRDHRRRNPFLVHQPDLALPWLRVHPAARRAALQRARRHAGGRQADLDVGAGAHAHRGG